MQTETIAWPQPINTSSTNVNTSPARSLSFYSAHVLPLAQVMQISKYRSGSGHDFTDGSETCRSMKHYIDPLTRKRVGRDELDNAKYPATVPIYSPVDGVVTEIVAEQYPLGKQVRLTPTDNPDFLVMLFHIFPLASIQTGSVVIAGEQIGTIKKIQAIDVAIEKKDPTGRGRGQFFSMFDIMSDAMLADYATVGVTKEKIIISKEWRDANPLTCEGDQFRPAIERLEDWVVLRHPNP